MKKHLILAAISAALVTAPFVDAIGKPSGFSSGKSSSTSSGSSGGGRASTASVSGGSRASTSSSSSTSTASASRRDSGSSGWGSSARTTVSPSPAAAPKRDYGSSWGSTTPARQAAPARATASDYAPASRVTPQLRQTEPTRVTPAPAAVPPSPAASGFADTRSGTKKKVAAVAGATALGGALYAAGANHDAVAAYQRSQEQAPAPAPAAPVSDRTASTATTTSAQVDSRPTVHASTPSIHVPQQPQVIVVREAPRYNDHADDAYWYQRGRDSAAREARISNPVTTTANPYGGSLAEDTPVVQPAPRASQVTQPAAPARSDESSGVGSFIMYSIVILMVLGAMGYLAMQVLNTDPTRKSRAARRKSNYTL